MKSYPITIEGETISIRTDGDPDKVQTLIVQLQSRYEEMSRGIRPPRSAQSLRIMTTVAMTILSELDALKTRHDRMGHQALNFARDLSTRIDELLVRGPE